MTNSLMFNAQRVALLGVLLDQVPGDVKPTASKFLEYALENGFGPAVEALRGAQRRAADAGDRDRVYALGVVARATRQVVERLPTPGYVPASELVLEGAHGASRFEGGYDGGDLGPVSDGRIATDVCWCGAERADYGDGEFSDPGWWRENPDGSVTCPVCAGYER